MYIALALIILIVVLIIVYRKFSADPKADALGHEWADQQREMDLRPKRSLEKKDDAKA